MVRYVYKHEFKKPIDQNIGFVFGDDMYILTHQLQFKTGDSFKCKGCYGSVHDDGIGGPVRTIDLAVRNRGQRSLDDFAKDCINLIYMRQQANLAEKGLSGILPCVKYLWLAMKWPVPKDSDWSDLDELKEEEEIINMDADVFAELSANLGVAKHFPQLMKLKAQESYMYLVLGKSFVDDFENLFDGVQSNNMKVLCEAEFVNNELKAFTGTIKSELSKTNKTKSLIISPRKMYNSFN